MRNFRFLTALLITIFFLNLKSSAQTDPAPDSDVITIRTYEVTSLSRSYMVIAYGNGKIEEVPLGDIGINSKGSKTNVDAISTIFGKILKDGYSLISSTGGQSATALVSTYIFAKKQNY